MWSVGEYVNMCIYFSNLYVYTHKHIRYILHIYEKIKNDCDVSLIKTKSFVHKSMKCK